MYKYSLQKLKSKAITLANEVTPPYTILLKGDLGTGKTTFAQFFIKQLLIDNTQPVSSPTFTIINEYVSTKGHIWHADLYRLKDETELLELGIIEFLQYGITLIEWPELIEPFIQSSSTTIISF